MMDDIDRSFEWWRMALQGQRGPIDADNPKAGFYRWVWKDRTTTPMTVTMGVSAYWYDSHDGSLRCQLDGKDIGDIKARTRWPHDSRRPISEAVFQAFRDTGKWTDVDDAAQSDEEISDAAPELNLAKQIADAKTSAAKYAKIDSDGDLVLAQSLRAKLMEHSSAADKLREAEKAPHLKACREVDAKWQPMIKIADATALAIRKSMEAFNDWKLEQAAKAAARSQASPGPTPVASNAPPPSVQVSGGGGRAAHVGVKDVVTEIDLDLAFAHFRLERSVSDLFFQLAQKAVDAGITVPGVKTEKRSAIR